MLYHFRGQLSDEDRRYIEQLNVAFSMSRHLSSDGIVARAEQVAQSVRTLVAAAQTSTPPEHGGFRSMGRGRREALRRLTATPWPCSGR